MSNDPEKEAIRIFGIAYGIAKKAHAGVFRRLPDARPYFEHVKDVAALMPTWDLKTVAILHDAIEDTVDKPEGTKVTEETLRAAEIPEHIIAGVVAMTKREGDDYEKYIQEQVKPNELARLVKMADNFVNLKDRIAALIAGDQTAAEKIHKYGLSLKILTE
jgi:(p)ppGpp synthase/HD superfamily hydrolase